MTVPLVSSELHVMFEDPQADVALDDDEPRVDGLHHLLHLHHHRLLLDGEVGEDLLGLLLNAGRSDGGAGREDHRDCWGGLERSSLDWRGFGLRASPRTTRSGRHWRGGLAGGGGGWARSGGQEAGAFLHVVLHVLGVAQLVGLQVFPQLGGVQQDDLLAEQAGMVDGVDDLPLGVTTVAKFVLSVGEGVLMGDMFPQPGEEVKSVADVAEDTTGQERVVAQLLGWLHLARLT